MRADREHQLYGKIMKKKIIELLPYIIHGAIAGFMMFEIIKHM